MRRYLALASALFCLAACDDVTGPDGDDDVVPSVFVMTNASANAVIMHTRNSDGTLSAGQSFATQGTGLGASLGSQGAVNLSDDHEWLIVANAGSDDITVFRVRPASLEFVQKISSGGDMPVSITRRGNVVFVLNAGGAGNVTGFNVLTDGKLTASGVVRPLSGAAAPMPAQIGFSPDGSMLVVTEKATNLILTYTVSASTGSVGNPVTHTAAGTTPFGFAFSPSGLLVVSEAFAPGGTAIPDGSAMSSYSTTGTFATISASVPTTETAACWVVITGDGKFAYTTNTGSNSITGYSIGTTGILSRLAADGFTSGSGGIMPVEMALSSDSRFLYALNGGNGAVGVFRVETTGALTLVGTTTGAPTNSYGMAAW